MLAPHNVTVDGINSRILGMLKTKEKIYLSTDESLIERPFDINAADDEEEALNKFNPSGLPLHELKLKEGAIIVLLKNLAVARGLVNGTRMVIKSLHDNIIMAEVITGTNAGTGKQVCLNRCWCDYEENGRIDGIKFRRFQFPVRLAFAMTIMKAQGQSVNQMGLDLSQEVFAHGNLYSAMSRVTREAGYRIYAPNAPTNPKTGSIYVKNIVAEGLDFLNE